MKNKIIITILFFLPLTVYIFFAAGINLFDKLPILQENVNEISGFEGSQEIKLEGNITILGFLGEDITGKSPYLFNLAHKIYKPYFQFNDLQFVMLVTDGNQSKVAELKKQLQQIAEIDKWKFIYGSSQQIQTYFTSLKTTENLDKRHSSQNVYIIDKDKNLRGRNEVGETIGYDTSTIASLNNKMRDDVKIILAEYRLALKKNNKYKRQI